MLITVTTTSQTLEEIAGEEESFRIQSASSEGGGSISIHNAHASENVYVRINFKAVAGECIPILPNQTVSLGTCNPGSINLVALAENTSIITS